MPRDDGRIYRNVEAYGKPCTCHYIDFKTDFDLSSITFFEYRKLYRTLVKNNWNYKEDTAVCIFLLEEGCTPQYNLMIYKQHD